MRHDSRQFAYLKRDLAFRYGLEQKIELLSKETRLKEVGTMYI
jgi:hypothetical protein